jgi:hypothetical protein
MVAVYLADLGKICGQLAETCGLPSRLCGQRSFGQLVLRGAWRLTSSLAASTGLPTGRYGQQQPVAARGDGPGDCRRRADALTSSLLSPGHWKPPWLLNKKERCKGERAADR